MELEEERRRFQRLLVTLPVEYSTFHPDSGEFLQGQGVLKDFSLGGVYFRSIDPVPLQPGHTLTLTIYTPLAPLSHHDSSHIQARAEVVRLEEPSSDTAYHGVAVSFLEFPSFINSINHLHNNN
ncbi:MAG: PilZ domain-containing protein [Thermodesulfobacteriota bacterium]